LRKSQLLHNPLRACRLGDDFRELRDIRVPFDERADRAADRFDRKAIEIPDWIDDRAFMRVDDDVAAVEVPRHMDLGHAVQREFADESSGVKPMIFTVDVDVVHVQKHPAARLLDHLVEEIGFGHLAPRHLHIVAGVLKQKRELDFFLELLHASHDVIRRLKRKRQGQ